MHLFISNIPLLLLWALLSVTCAIAQLSALVGCSGSCLYDAVTGAGCLNTNYQCVCLPDVFSPVFVPCVIRSCTQTESQYSLMIARDACGIAGDNSQVPSASSTVSQESTDTIPIAGAPSGGSTLSTSRTTSEPPSLPITPTTTTTGLSSNQPITSTSLDGPPAAEPTSGALNSNGTRLSTGAIAGITVGVGGLVISLIVCLYIIYRLKSGKRGVPSAPVAKDSNPPNPPELGGIGPDNDLPGQLVR
ncbi:hypothetical protein TWF730_005312 [Orbilia blumenaviensis]|uniref:CFEM domain-containing protein n=1 Tax=Orbilia blumenaviensis TaxID=1796055 RepID=A0AAV9VKW1_9PEZI